MKIIKILLIILLAITAQFQLTQTLGCQTEVNCQQAFAIESTIFQNWFNGNAGSIEAFFTFNQVTSNFIIQMVYQNPAFVYINDLVATQNFLYLNGNSIGKITFNVTSQNQRSLQNVIVTTEISSDDFNALNCSQLSNDQIKVCPFEFRIFNKNYQDTVFGSVLFDVETFAQNTSSVDAQSLIYLKAKMRTTYLTTTEQQLYQYVSQYNNLSYSTVQLNYENITQFQLQENENPEYLWGTYKPYLLYGLTQRKDQPLTMRFLYSMDDNKKDTSNLRYTPKDSSDDNLIANFLQHNGIDYANQEIIDRYYNLKFNTVFLKQNSSANKQKWSSIIHYDETNTKQFDKFQKYWNKEIINYFTLGLESWSGLDNGDYLISKVNSTNIIEHRAADTGLLGVFQVRLFVNNEEVINSQVQMTTLETINKQQNWDIENTVYWSNLNTEPSVMLNANQNEVSSSNNAVDGTLALIKIQIPTNVNYSIVIDYESITFIEYEQRYQPTYLSLSELQDLQLVRSSNFTEQFQQLFLNNIMANDTQYNDCSQASLSNLLGGINYMFGPVLIDQWNCYVQPKVLFSGTPARAGFPRGFLWDDGFHQLLFCQWNRQLCMMVQESWLNTQLPEGWINREQIRGYEVENYANPGFMIQLIKQSNPPSIMLSLDKLFDYMYDGEEINMDIYDFFERNFVYMFNYYYWFINDYLAPNTTQMLFRWQTLDHLYYLDSGMDDWPRNSDNYLAKYTVDLHSWVILYTKNLLKFAQVFGTKPDIYLLEDNLNTLMINLNQYYLDSSDNLYKDVLQSVFNESQIHSPHLGYVNIFPLFFGLINETSPAFTATLNLIKNETVMWTQFGLRSLSLNDFFQGTASYYWRGPIWINIQYLLLKGLLDNYSNNEQAMQIYQELRSNVIDVVCQNYYGKGYFFENFDSHTGLGQDNHPFTGWTTLVSLMINSFDNVKKIPQVKTS